MGKNDREIVMTTIRERDRERERGRKGGRWGKGEL